MQPSRWDDWMRWLIGGLIAGLVAWGGIGQRLSALETTVTLTNLRSADDRAQMLRTIENLQKAISGLTDELHREEQARVNGEQRGAAAGGGPVFQRGQRFDK